MISVVTIVRGRARHLERQVQGLVNGRRIPDEFIVVIMGGEDPTRNLPAAPFPVRTWWCEPAGSLLPLARARNLGVAAAQHEKIVLLDVDCIPGGDLVARYSAALDEADGLLMGQVRYLGPHDADDDWTEADLHARSLPHPARPVPTGDGLTPTDRYELFWSLSFALHRRTFASTIGGFDEQLDGYGAEDTDLAFTARERGVPLFWLPGAVAYHQHHETYAPPLTHLRSIVSNARRFRSKWGTWPMEGWLTAFVELGLVSWDPDGTSIEVLRDPTDEEIAGAHRTHVVSEA